ncbi:MAG: hypothetical protein M0T86_03915 [Betaproteobacteria bacterium]|nr:hypothetical protein [Betaproteobacteria bacterium]
MIPVELVVQLCKMDWRSVAQVASLRILADVADFILTRDNQGLVITVVFGTD